MKHKYIDAYKLRDFSEKLTIDDISKDFDKFEIHNIAFEDKKDWNYDEYRYYLEEALWDDYRLKRANYKAYIESGMDARFMMELRKSALIPIDDKRIIHFYSDHSTFETIQEIHEFRAKFLKFVNETYMDFDWQLYTLIRYCWARQGSDIVIDYECCFKDGDARKMRNPNHYRADWLAQHIPPERLKWIV